MGLSSVEICAGAGGQALGLEMAGFNHAATVEIDPWACRTLRANRGETWNVIEQDVTTWDAAEFQGVDLFAGGVPCPPFSVAGKQLGSGDERDLFPTAMRLIEHIRPRAVMLENVRGLLEPRFDTYRNGLNAQLEHLGYAPHWALLHASDYGVPQLRPRVVLVALADGFSDGFEWPAPLLPPPPTVGETLVDLMAADGWTGAAAWAAVADTIAPTLVGGSKKHGGPDLGPTRARRAWAALGVEGKSLANHAPAPDHEGMPRLTTRMAARIQGFPDHWEFAGPKTHSYRQIGNAFPPPVAHAVGVSIAHALGATLKRAA